MPPESGIPEDVKECVVYTPDASAQALLFQFIVCINTRIEKTRLLQDPVRLPTSQALNSKRESGMKRINVALGMLKWLPYWFCT
jgi:hypothetical protein